MTPEIPAKETRRVTRSNVRTSAFIGALALAGAAWFVSMPADRAPAALVEMPDGGALAVKLDDLADLKARLTRCEEGIEDVKKSLDGDAAP